MVFLKSTKYIWKIIWFLPWTNISQIKNVSAYRKNYSSQHVLIRLLEEWKKCLGNNYVVGGVPMDLSKAFDCVPRDLLIAKLEAYGINENLLAYLHSYLSNRKQCVRSNNVTSDFETITSRVPQGSIVGPILFNCFFNDFFYFIEKASIHNFVDDNTLSMFDETIQKFNCTFTNWKQYCHWMVPKQQHDGQPW